jgi:hypothetical protein
LPARTPERIKEKVIKFWLLGLKRDQIGEKVGTSVGNIMHIVAEAKKAVPDITLLRETAVWIRKNGWKQDVFSSAIRHRNILYNKGLTDQQIDDLIELVDEHCFRRNIPIGSFIDSLENISTVSKKYGCSIEGLDDLISKKESQVEEWQDKEISAMTGHNETLKKNKVTEEELIQYKNDLPLVNTIKVLRQNFQKLKESKTFLNPTRADMLFLYGDLEAENLTIDDINKAIRLLIDHHLSFLKEIKLILARKLDFQKY